MASAGEAARFATVKATKPSNFLAFAVDLVFDGRSEPAAANDGPELDQDAVEGVT